MEPINSMLIMKTRIQKLLVCAALVGAATLAQAQFFYNNNGNGTCTITGYYLGPYGAVTIPSSISGLTVVSIGDSAFYNKGGITSVVIPDTVTNIGNSAFDACTSLTSVTIPSSVTNIGSEAFWSCSKLFRVSIGSGVSSIGDDAFASCTSLTSVTIPNSVTSIGSGAFLSCYKLTAITVDPANPVYSSAGGVLFDKNQTALIQCPAVLGGSYTIPNSVTNIGSRAFDSCISLTSVTSIGDYAFYYCYSLTSVTIPASVTSIGSEAFRSCTELTAAYFLGNAPLDGGAVFSYYGIGLVVYYLPGATGWGPFFSGAPTELWNP